jgi:hypothetical protein
MIVEKIGMVTHFIASKIKGVDENLKVDLLSNCYDN